MMSEELDDLVRKSCLLIRHAYRHVSWRGDELELAYSGGKDSDVMLELCRMSNVKVRVIHRCTTIDPSGTLKHCLDAGAEILRPRRDFRGCIERSGFPSRFVRHCCGELKEYAVCDYVLVGVRRSESVAREKRYTCDEDLVAYNGRGRAYQYYPLLNWRDEHIEEFIRERGIKCHPLYYDADGVFHVERRLGCMCCPLQYWKRRIEEFRKNPRMVRLYLRAGRRYMLSHPDSTTCKTFGDVYEWFVCDVMCKDMDDFRRRFKSESSVGQSSCQLDLFSSSSSSPADIGGVTDFRRYLEDFFGIDLGGLD